MERSDMPIEGLTYPHEMSDWKYRQYLKGRITAFYKERDAEDIYIKITMLPWGWSIDPIYVGHQYVVQVRYDDPDEQTCFYQMAIFPDPQRFTSTDEEAVAFIDRHIGELYHCHKYEVWGIYGL